MLYIKYPWFYIFVKGEINFFFLPFIENYFPSSLTDRRRDMSSFYLDFMEKHLFGKMFSGKLTAIND